MATKIPRKTQKIFAGSAANNGQFGSAQAGTKVTTTDITTIMALPAWDTGWNSATISSLQLPPLEEMQGVQYVQTTQIAYLLQEGIAEYDAGTHYFQNSVVKQVGTTKLYKSKTDDNVGNALTDTVNWQFLLDLANPESNVIWGGTAGGTANAITITSTLSALPTPAIILFLASANNTAATTLVVGTAPSINITKGGNGVVGLAPNDITTGKLIAVIFDGTEGQLLNPPAFAHGADVAAAATTILDNTSGDILNITGNTGISAVTLKEGRLKVVKFSGTPILTYGASLLLNTNGGNYTCAANDVAIFYGLAGGVVVGTILPANGSSPVPPAQTFTASGGDVTGTGLLTTNISLIIGANKVLTAMINNTAVTYAKIQNGSANSVMATGASSGAYAEVTLTSPSLLGRGSSAIGVITLDPSLGMSSNVLAVTQASTSQLGGAQTAAASDSTTGTSTTKVMTPAVMKNHKGVAKAWANFAGATGSINASYNISSITRNSTGDYTVAFSTAMADANYVSGGMCLDFNSVNPGVISYKLASSLSTSGFNMRSWEGAGGGTFDSTFTTFSVHGN